MSVVAVRVAESWSSCVVGPRGWRAPAGRGACCALGRAREASAGGGGMAPMPPLSGGGSGGSAPPSPAGAAPTPTASSLLLRGVLSSASGRFFAWNPIKRDAASVSWCRLPFSVGRRRVRPVLSTGRRQRYWWPFIAGDVLWQL